MITRLSGRGIAAVVPGMALAILACTGTTFAASEGVIGEGRTVAEVLERLRSPDKEIRDDALGFRLYPALRDPVLLPVIARMALEDPEEGVRISAFFRLKDLGPAARDALPILAEGVSDRRPERRKAALDALMHIEDLDSTTVDRIAPALRDTSADVRRAAMYALGRVRPPTARSIAELVSALDRIEDGFMLFGLVGALEQSGEGVLPAIEPLLLDRDPARRALGVMALPGVPAALPSLLAAARDSDETVRLVAVRKLSNVEPRTEEIRRVLRETSAADPDSAVSMFARLGDASDPDSVAILSSIETGQARMNRDTTAFAYDLKARHYRDATPLDQLAIFGAPRHEVGSFFEIHVYDLAKREGPRRIARWATDSRENLRIVGWDAQGIVVARGEGDTIRAVRLDPVTGESSDFGPTDEKTLGRLGSELNHLGSGRDERHRTHVEEGTGEYLLWSPMTRTRELLVSVPLEHDGHRDPQARSIQEYRERDRYSDSIHRIWEARTVRTNGATRFVVETSVPRAGTEARDYVLELVLEVPDTTQEKNNVFADIHVPLADKAMRLGPTGTTIEIDVPDRRVLDVVAPYRRSSRIRPPTYSNAVWLALRPIARDGDEQRMPPGILRGRAGLGYTHIEVPLR